MTSVREKAVDYFYQALSLVRRRRDKTPIDSVAKLEDFVGTRSAYIAQKTLYGYVKTRMGINYPRMFDNKSFILSLNIAKEYVFAACLSDLTVYAVAMALHEQPADNTAREALARRCYESALSNNTADAPKEFAAQDCIQEFALRLKDVNWQHARGPDVFTRSPQALVRWAPIADVLKDFDREIVENSVKFAWPEIRYQLTARIDGAAIYNDLSRPR
jgi:hypothetical protein